LCRQAVDGELEFVTMVEQMAGSYPVGVELVVGDVLGICGEEKEERILVAVLIGIPCAL
jgi:hypothetical protein